MALELPDPILKSDIKRWARVLTLSEAQSIVLEQLLRQYDERDRVLTSEILPPLWQRASELANCEPHQCDPDPMYDLREQVVSKLIAAELPLFDTLQTILSDTQAGALPRVRQMRTRQCAQFVVFRQPAAGVDLSELLDQMFDGGMSLPEIDAILLPYEQSLTTLLVQQSDAQWKARREGQKRMDEFERAMALAATGGEPVSPVHPARLEFQRLWKNVARLQERIFDLNRLYVALLANALPSPQAELFVTEYRKRAYPSVYPDVHDLSDVFHAVEGVSLDEVARAAVAGIYEEYDRNHSRICERMEEAEFRLKDEQLSTASSSMEQYVEYKSRMVALQSERAEIRRITLERLSQVIGEPASSVSDAIAVSNRRVAEHRAIDKPPNDYRP